MNNRERTLAVLRYQPYDRLPIVHFGFWGVVVQELSFGEGSVVFAAE